MLILLFQKRRRESALMSSQDKMVESISNIFASIHESVALCSKKMLLEMKRPNYVTPTNYLELVTGYKKFAIHFIVNYTV